MDDHTMIDALQEARRQALLDAAGVLREWLRHFGGFQPEYLSAQTWVADGMSDCIAEIEGMAGMQDVE